jgi:phosphoserine phosphatase
MQEEKLYIIHGTGGDKVGLVKDITRPLAEAGGNIVDLRQDVMHGLFTIYLVVDLTHAGIDLERFRGIVAQIAAQTDLTLSVDKYTPIARDPEKKNILLILIGADRTGIAAKISETLSRYKINIEFSQMIAREQVFLMELLADISHCTLPLSNLDKVLRETMQAMKITALTQSDDVFNKAKRVIIFNLTSSFMHPDLQAEILNQVGIAESDFKKRYAGKPAARIPQAAHELLDGLPLPVVENVIGSVRVTPDTVELLQTLKIMGYKIALVSPAFLPLLELLKNRLALDHCFGFPLCINDDTKTVSSELLDADAGPPDENRVKEFLRRQEGVRPEDITTLGSADAAPGTSPGIHLEFDLKLILDYHNQHILSRENIMGLLGGFGFPHGERQGK